MNKYEEALHDLKMAYKYPKSKYNDSRLIEIRLNTLSELVERAIPKKPIKDEISRIRYVPTYVCPNCKGSFSGRLTINCYHCGQLLDWSEEK